ncbi:hypothetical protein Tco_0955054 [Tanacetum coccineum]|uniref:Secreted protein n=1 Tax=Tanacetum coccineum TaxID=301880 RepID=A0ABQ5E633_9ASTR
MLVTWWCVGVVVFDDGVDIVVRWVSVDWRMVVVKMMMVKVVCGVVWDSSGSGFDNDGGRLLVVMVRRWTAPGPNSSDHNVNTITNGDEMPRMRTFRETIFPE